MAHIDVVSCASLRKCIWCTRVVRNVDAGKRRVCDIARPLPNYLFCCEIVLVWWTVLYTNKHIKFVVYLGNVNNEMRVVRVDWCGWKCLMHKKTVVMYERNKIESPIFFTLFQKLSNDDKMILKILNFIIILQSYKI